MYLLRSWHQHAPRACALLLTYPSGAQDEGTAVILGQDFLMGMQIHKGANPTMQIYFKLLFVLPPLTSTGHISHIAKCIIP